VHTYSLTHLADSTLLSNLAVLVAKDRLNTAALLAHLAEVEARKLYAAAGYPTMHAYCVDKWGLSEGGAYRRTQAASAARKFPVLFDAVADGRLHLAAVCLLAPKLTPENVDELVAIATHQRKSEIERLLAERYPRTELMAMVQPMDGAAALDVPHFAPGQNGSSDSPPEFAPGQNRVAEPTARVVPHARERYRLDVTVGSETYDKLCRAQELLSHAIPGGDIAAVLDRALDALVQKLEARKFGMTTKPRRSTQPATGARTIPANIRRAVSQRDADQCTFVSEDGHRCAARTRLEFDHVEPVARGGETTASNLRLRCRTHNRYEADRAFGTDFMNAKREQARREARAPIASEASVSQPCFQAPTSEHTHDLLNGLRHLRVRDADARLAIAYAAAAAEPTLEAQMRAALEFLAPRAARTGAPAA
jgi:hypothetical protein